MKKDFYLKLLHVWYSVLVGFIWQHTSRRRQDTNLLLSQEDRSPGFPLGLHWHSGAGDCLILLHGVGLPAPHWASTDISMAGGLGFLFLTWLPVTPQGRCLRGGESPVSPTTSVGRNRSVLLLQGVSRCPGFPFGLPWQCGEQSLITT